MPELVLLLLGNSFVTLPTTVESSDLSRGSTTFSNFASVTGSASGFTLSGTTERAVIVSTTDGSEEPLSFLQPANIIAPQSATRNRVFLKRLFCQ